MRRSEKRKREKKEDAGARKGRKVAIPWRRQEVRRSEKRKREKKEDAGARKGRKVAIHCVFFQ